jgi:phosphoglucan,water dikinase
LQRAALLLLAAAADATALSPLAAAASDFAPHRAGGVASSPNRRAGRHERGRRARCARAPSRSARAVPPRTIARCSLRFLRRARRRRWAARSVIDAHVVEVFTEGQIRASVVFQSAKLASHLLRAARDRDRRGWLGLHRRRRG